jgi:hypothetical protein
MGQRSIQTALVLAALTVAARGDNLSNNISKIYGLIGIIKYSVALNCVHIKTLRFNLNNQEHISHTMFLMKCYENLLTPTVFELRQFYQHFVSIYVHTF